MSWVMYDGRPVPLSPAVEIVRNITASLAGSSVAITAGTGIAVAAVAASGAYHQVFVEAGPDGHIIGTKASYLCFFTAVTNVTNREVCNLFVASTASQFVRIRGLWALPTQTAITGVVIQFNVNKTSTQGATATAVTPRPTDSTYAALATGIRAGFGSVTLPTVTWIWFQQFAFNDELSPGNGLSNYVNLLPVGVGERPAEIVLRPGEGLNMVQSNAATVGLTGALMYFMVE